jgi:glutamate carboxypeptidase
MDTVIATLKKYVDLPSGSYDKSDVETLAQTLAGDFADAGMRSRLIPNAVMGPALACEYGSGDRQLMLMGHMDTVFPHADYKPFSLNGNIASGSGTCDMKGGIAVMLHALRRVLPLVDTAKYTVHVLLNPDEEVGSLTSAPLILNAARRSFAALSFEPAGEGGRLTCERKGVTSFAIRCRGVGGHAGAAYKTTFSAIQALCELIGRLYALRDDARDISINIGRVAGGTCENVVADSAAAYGEYRYYDPAIKDEIGKRIMEACALVKVPCTGAEVAFGTSHPAIKASKGSLELFERARAIAASQGRELRLESTGGAGDIAIAGQAGIPVLDGLGTGGGGIHTLDEYADISLLPQQVDLAARLIRELLP